MEVSYGPEAGIPSGAKLAVSELTGDAAEEYYNEALKAVENDGNNGENAGNNKKTTLKYAKALDISILKDGVEVHPVAPVSVSIKLLDAPSTDEFDEANVVHFGGEVELVDCNVQREAVGFETDAFSVYVVTYTLSTFYMDAAGNTFNIEVEYDREAGIPEGAGLRVSELEGDVAGTYAARAAEALNVASGQLAYAKALDIAILVDGQPVQPTKPVYVSIRLLDAPEVDENTNVNVLHFGEEVEPVSCALNGENVEFEADGFSVYVIAFTATVNEQEYTYALSAGESIKLSELLTLMSLTGIDLTDAKVEVIENSQGFVITEENEDWTLTTVDDQINGGIQISLKEGSTPSVVIINLISKRALTITADSDTKVYDGTELMKDSYTSTALATGDRIESVTVTGSQTVAGTSDNVPSAAVIINTDGEDVTNGYAITYANGTLEVTQKTLTITADSDTKVYNGTALTKDSFTNTALAEGDSIESVTVTGSQTVAGTSDNVPSAAVIKNTVGEDVTDSYEITYAKGTLEVQKATPNIDNPPTGIENLAYTGEKQVLISAGTTVEEIALLYALGEDGNAIPETGWSEDIPTAVNAGTYYVYYKVEGGDNYNDIEASAERCLSVDIDKVGITIKANDNTKVYDGTTDVEAGEDSYHITAGQLVAGDSLASVKLTASSKDAIDNNTVTPSEAVIVRSVAIQNGDGAEGETTGTVDVTANYDITYEPGELTIEPRPVTVKADDISKKYSKEDPALTAAITGLVSGDQVQYTLTREEGENAGTYIITATGESQQGNYSVTYESGDFTIDPMPVSLVAKSGSVLQSDENPEAKTIEGYICTTKADDGHTITLFDTEDEEPRMIFSGVSAYGSGKDVGMYEVKFTGVTVNETRDATGNYIVTEAISGMLIITTNTVEPAITKTMTSFNGNLATYSIVVNPGDDDLNEGDDTLVLKDTFSSNQSIIYNTIKVKVNDAEATDDEVTYDYSGYTGTFIIPDQSKVSIEYTTRVSGVAGQKVVFDNTARLGKYDDDNKFIGCASTVNEERIITPTGTDISGTDGKYTIELFVYPENQMETGLGGVTFRLLDSNQRPIQVNNKDVTFTTATKRDVEEDAKKKLGYVTISLDGEQAIRKNTVYYLEMVNTPYSETQDTTTGDPVYTYYQKDNTLYNFLITDTPGYAQTGVYSYYNGDTLKVRCYPEAKGVNVTKRFSGNYSLAKEKQNNIVFELQEDNPDGGWDHVEDHPYSQFSFGSMNFDAGKPGGPSLKDSTTYQVIESNADPDDLGLEEGVELNTSYTVSYQSGGKQMDPKPGNSFTIFADDPSYSYSIVVNNEYIDHKLTLGLLDEGKGKMLPGGVFTVYDKGGNIIATYTTDTSGMLDIRKNESYADDILYYAVQTAAPEGYLLPKQPQKVYFYFGGRDDAGNPTDAPDNAPADATDLSNSYNTVIIGNQANVVRVPVTVTWGFEESSDWPEDPVRVHHIVLRLVQSTDGGETFTPVKKNGVDMTIELTPEQFFDNSTFVDLPAQSVEADPDDPNKTIVKDIVYSIEEDAVYKDAIESAESNITTSYAAHCSISGTGWYVVNHQPAVSVTVEKQWFPLRDDENTDPERITGEELNSKPQVTFDLYRTEIEFTKNEFTRDELETFLSNAESNAVKERTGIALNNENNWRTTVDSLPAAYPAGNSEQPYYYYTIESGILPDNHEDTYVVTPAGDGTLRMLTIKNTQTPITVNINAQELTKRYGDDDPEFAFRVKVQDSGTTVSAVTAEGTHSTVSGPDASGYYTVTGKNSEGKYDISVKTGEEDAQTITFECERAEGENVSDSPYAITPTGDTTQGGYRIKFNRDAKLIITQKRIVVKADRSKEYGDKVVFEDGEWKSTETKTDWVSFYHEEPVEGGEGTELVRYAQVDDDGDITLERGDKFTVIEFSAEREDPDEDVGSSYAITLSGTNSQGNYYVTFENGFFEITPAEAVVTPNPAQRVYGDSDPELTATVTGLRFDDSPETIDYTLEREPGENVRKYAITASGEQNQGNYHVTFETTDPDTDQNWFTIIPAEAKLTVESVEKEYGEADPDEWDADIEGLQPRDIGTITYTIDRVDGEDAGEYVLTPIVDDFEEEGEETTDEGLEKYYLKGNYKVFIEPGTLTIDKAELVIKANDFVRLKTTEESDNDYTETPTGLKARDALDLATGLERHIEAGTGENEGKYVVSYTRKGSDEGAEPEITFTLSRAPGTEPSVYEITAQRIDGKAARNYTMDFDTGSYTILDVFDVVVSQRTVDPTDATSNPSYMYEWNAVLDSVGYNESGSFDLPIMKDGTVSNATTLQIPESAVLTVTQQPNSSDVDYETTLFVDDSPYNNTSGTPNRIRQVVDEYYELTFTHSRNCLPIQARKQSEPNTEAGAIFIDGSSGFAAIPEGVLKIGTYEAEYRAAYAQELSSDLYYVYEHASLYSVDGTVDVPGVTGVRFDARSNKWQYTTDDPDDVGATFNPVLPGDQLVLFYTPKYTCKIVNVKFYTLKAAMDYVKAQSLNTAVIEMLIENYSMREFDANAMTIPEDKTITIKTAQTEYEGPEGSKAVITRDASFTTKDMFTVNGVFTLENIIIDGGGKNTDKVTVSVKKGADPDRTPQFTLGAGATLRNAKGNNGAAIWAEAGETQINGTVTGNSAANGAAVYVKNNAEVTVSGTIGGAEAGSGNTATANGGAAYIESGTLTVENGGKIQGNSATVNGGAVYVANANGALVLNNGSNVLDNTAANGGAVYVNGGTLNLNGGAITGNTASNDGGGLYVNGGAATLNESSVIQDNTATGNGGGLYVNAGTVDVNSGSTVGDATKAHGNSAVNGGGIYKAGGTLNLNGGAITGNTASNNGGGLFTVNTQTVGGSVTNNTASANGGGIYSGGGTLTSTAAITGNTATAGNGGGIYQTSGTLNLNGGSVSYNTATAGNGGGISALNVDTTVPGTNRTDLYGNKADSGKGGVIYMEGGSLTVGTENVKTYFGETTEDKSNTAQYGGAVYATSGAITIKKGYFKGNQASASGGLVYAQSASVTVEGGEIKNNVANQGNGGAIYSASGAVSISGGTLSGNEAKNTAGNETDGLGGAVYAGTGNVTCDGGTNNSNKAVNGAAIFVGSGIATMRLYLHRKRTGRRSIP